MIEDHFDHEQSTQSLLNYWSQSWIKSHLNINPPFVIDIDQSPFFLVDLFYIFAPLWLMFFFYSPPPPLPPLPLSIFFISYNTFILSCHLLKQRSCSPATGISNNSNPFLCSLLRSLQSINYIGCLAIISYHFTVNLLSIGH